MTGDNASVTMYAQKRIVGGLECGASADLTATDALSTAKIHRGVRMFMEQRQPVFQVA
jgi:hypothetical protein